MTSSSSSLLLQLLLFMITAAGNLTSAIKTVNICPSRTHEEKSSMLIQSPRYPESYYGYENNDQECVLVLPVPEYSLVTVYSKALSVRNYYCNAKYYSADLQIYAPNMEYQRICGIRNKGKELASYYSGEISNSAIVVRFQPYRYNNNYNYNYKFNIKYTVFTILETNLSRLINSENQLYFINHQDFNREPISVEPSDSSLTITGIAPHTDILLEFPNGVILPSTENCMSYIAIIGVRGYTNSIKHICNDLAEEFTLNLTTTGSEISIRYVIMSSDIAARFMLIYNVLHEGCSDEELSSNAILTPISDSNSYFSLTCLPGFIASDFSQTQNVECVDGQWTPSFPCQEIPIDVTQLISADAPATDIPAASFTASAFYSSIGGLVAALVVVIALVAVIACIVLRRRQQPKQASDAAVNRNENLNASGSSGRDENYAEHGNIMYDEAQYSGVTAGKPAAPVPVERSAASRYGIGDQIYSEPDTYELEAPISREATSVNEYSLADDMDKECSSRTKRFEVEERKEVKDIYANIKKSQEAAINFL